MNIYAAWSILAVIYFGGLTLIFSEPHFSLKNTFLGVMAIHLIVVIIGAITILAFWALETVIR